MLSYISANGLFISQHYKLFIFQDVQHQTAEMTETFSRIYLINKKLGGKKIGQKIFKNPLPCEGSILVLLSTDFIAQMSAIAELSDRIEDSQNHVFSI